MFYTVYKITNNIDGKVYIGMHKTIDLNDGYFGSGKLIRRAIAKYGIENFSKEYLAVLDDFNEMVNMEKRLVTPEFVLRKDTYNLKEGGRGGFDHMHFTHDEHSVNNKKSAATIRRRCEEDPDFKEALKSKRKKASQLALETIKKRCELDPQFGEYLRNVRFTNCSKAFKGKKHTIETKEKIGKSNSIKQKGELNSQYGTCFIYNSDLKENKRIKKEDLEVWLSKGWVKGRKMSFS